VNCDSFFSKFVSFSAVLTKKSLLFELHFEISSYQKFTYVTLSIADGDYKTISFQVGCRRFVEFSVDLIQTHLNTTKNLKSSSNKEQWNNELFFQKMISNLSRQE